MALKALKDSYKAFILSGYGTPGLREGEGGAVTTLPEAQQQTKAGRGDARAERRRFGTRMGSYLQPNSKLGRKIYHSHPCQPENAKNIVPAQAESSHRSSPRAKKRTGEDL